MEGCQQTYHNYPEGPSTQYLRTLIPKIIKSMVFGARNLKYWILGPSGLSYKQGATVERT